MAVQKGDPSTMRFSAKSTARIRKLMGRLLAASEVLPNRTKAVELAIAIAVAADDKTFRDAVAKLQKAGEL